MDSKFGFRVLGMPKTRKPYTLLIFSLQKLQVFTVSQIPLQFHCIFYRQPTVNIFLQFLHSIFALFVCKKCSESAVGFEHSEKPALPLQILAVYLYTFSNFLLKFYTILFIKFFKRETMMYCNHLKFLGQWNYSIRTVLIQ